MADLKLLALDTDDLAVISAHTQDSVFRTDAISFSAKAGQFAIGVNRFVWEDAPAKVRSFERRRALLAFKRVRAVRSTGVDRTKTDDVHSLLAIRFVAGGEGPEGTLELTLSGGAAIALDVECIEVQLADTGPAWETVSKPRHPGLA